MFVAFGDFSNFQSQSDAATVKTDAVGCETGVVRLKTDTDECKIYGYAVDL